ncbi:hypothetical protein HKD22_09730 [Gluconobacter kanchanaburiensis]|nr:hypothetical protein [Gluconobacter kanchanaburiensis]
MSHTKRLPAFLGALSLPFLMSAVRAAPVEDKPSFPTLSYWDNWTDPQGTTHLTKCRMSAFHDDSTSSNGHETLLSTPHKGDVTMTVRVQPSGWKGEWSETRQTQWIVPLSGIYSVTAMDGNNVELNPGDILLSEDVSPSASGPEPKGHLEKNVGDSAVALQILSFADATPSHVPCQWH